jgi:hypothetical protein
MRVVASIQAKRGSSRGLVHYIAHSKLDIEREPQESRELFNAFTNKLSVKSANNSMRAGIAKGRPSNDELHHLVLSFRRDDYRKLGENEARRRQALKDITRAAMKALETPTNAERLLWAAAVHRNTENPHVHIAIQKLYFTKEIERQVLKKIPREALPHYEVHDVEKVLVPGFLFEAAATKMEAIITRERTRAKVSKQAMSRESSKEHSIGQTASKPNQESAIQTVTERDALRKGTLAEYELRYRQSKIDYLLDHGDKMRFMVPDPVSGRRRRLSLREIEQRETDRDSAPERQIKAILLKMLAKEEAAKIQLQSEMADAILKADRIRSEHRKSGRKLPIPSLTKEELDKVQEQSLEASDIRRFSYLERIRTELERSGEIDPRNQDDLRSILAQKIISELRSRAYEKKHSALSDRGYYRPVDLGDRSLSLAQLDREKKAFESSVFSIFEKLKNTAARLSKKASLATRTNETKNVRNDIVNKLGEQLASILKDQKVEQDKAQILAKVLDTNPENYQIDASYSPEQMAEIETLSVRLKLKTEYEKNWNEQRSLIESAGSDCPAYRKLVKADPTADFAEHKDRIIVGRVLAREIVAKVEFDKAKEDLKTFQETKRFQKFAIADKKSGSVAYLSPHDVDLPARGSLLDRAVDELFEGREHRTLRRTVGSLVKEKERRLRDDVTAAKEIVVSAARNASEFKDFSFFGLRSETSHPPIFTSTEIETLELRAANTRNIKEAERLRAILEPATDRPALSTTEILRDFEGPQKAPSEGRKIGPPSHEASSQTKAVAPNHGLREATKETGKLPKSSERSFQDHLR